jgi:hypothetical protein
MLICHIIGNFIVQNITYQNSKENGKKRSEGKAYRRTIKLDLQLFDDHFKSTHLSLNFIIVIFIIDEIHEELLGQK